MKFIDSDINSTISIHRGLIENQSLISKYIGPINDFQSNREHYLKYYQQILSYKRANPAETNQKIIEDLEWLIEELEK